MHKSATKCNETVGKWCKSKHGASKIIDTLETYHTLSRDPQLGLYSGTHCDCVSVRLLWWVVLVACSQLCDAIQQCWQ
jgi:hypothetical protein